MSPVILNRFTKRAKANIEQVFPGSTLPMEEEERLFKYGQFGYGKYVYPTETMATIKGFFEEKLRAAFPQSQIKYIV